MDVLTVMAMGNAPGMRLWSAVGAANVVTRLLLLVVLTHDT